MLRLQRSASNILSLEHTVSNRLPFQRNQETGRSPTMRRSAQITAIATLNCSRRRPHPPSPACYAVLRTAAGEPSVREARPDAGSTAVAGVIA